MRMGTLSVMSSKGMSEGEEMDMDTLDVTSVHGTDSTEHPHKLKTVKSMSDGVADDIKVLKDPDSRKPTANPYTQQKLPVWNPIISTAVTIWTMLGLGLLLLAMGGIFYATAEGIVFVSIDYTECVSVTPGITGTCADYVATSSVDTDAAVCECNLVFTAPSGFQNEDLYFYYYLDNYYQNFRRYVASVDYQQLHGEGLGNLDPGCGDEDMIDGVQVLPCGYIANSYFNDTFSVQASNGTDVVFNDENIAWNSDVSFKYRNPASGFNDTVTPPNWGGRTVAAVLGESGLTNQDFAVWMRTAGLPWFHKLYRKIPGGLVTGQNYTVSVQYNYPTKVFNGHKEVLITTISWLGAQNHFLGIIYLAAGSVACVIGLAFLFAQLCAPRRFGDPKYLKWNRHQAKEVKIPL